MEQTKEQKAQEMAKAQEIYQAVSDTLETEKSFLIEPWLKLPKFEKENIVQLINKIDSAENITVEVLHNYFVKTQMQKGFKHGSKRNGVDKTHNRIIGFASLSPKQVFFYDDLIIAVQSFVKMDEEE